MLINTKYRSILNFGGFIFTVLELCTPFTNGKVADKFQKFRSSKKKIKLDLSSFVHDYSSINYNQCFLKSSVKIGVIFLCPDWKLNRLKPMLYTMQYSILLPTDKSKQFLPFSAYKHFDYHSRVMSLYNWKNF